MWPGLRERKGGQMKYVVVVDVVVEFCEEGLNERTRKKKKEKRTQIVALLLAKKRNAFK